jgi:hypothetical protein
MITRRWTFSAILLASTSAGLGVGLVVSQADPPQPARHEVESIPVRGIRGIDAVRLQNLEAVLRLQAPPLPPVGDGGGGAAATLLTMESDEPLELEQEVDGREELADLEMEGS